MCEQPFTSSDVVYCFIGHQAHIGAEICEKCIAELEKDIAPYLRKSMRNKIDMLKDGWIAGSYDTSVYFNEYQDNYTANTTATLNINDETDLVTLYNTGVGIGTVTPAHHLTINNNIYSADVAIDSASAGDLRISITSEDPVPIDEIEELREVYQPEVYEPEVDYSQAEKIYRNTLSRMCEQFAASLPNSRDSPLVAVQ